MNHIKEFLNRIGRGEDTVPSDIYVMEEQKMTTNERILAGLGLEPIPTNNKEKPKGRWMWSPKSCVLPVKPSVPPMSPVKAPKQEKIRRIYEDDDFIIDLFPGEKMVRVSVFDNCHYKDGVIVRKSDYVE